MVRGPQIAGSSLMGPLRLRPLCCSWPRRCLWEASQHCGRLEYWNPDNRCCAAACSASGRPARVGAGTGRLYSAQAVELQGDGGRGRGEVCVLRPVSLLQGRGRWVVHRRVRMGAKPAKKGAVCVKRVKVKV